jgi:hypothetical protein
MDLVHSADFTSICSNTMWYAGNSIPNERLAEGTIAVGKGLDFVIHKEAWKRTYTTYEGTGYAGYCSNLNHAGEIDSDGERGKFQDLWAYLIRTHGDALGADMYEELIDKLDDLEVDSYDDEKDDDIQDATPKGHPTEHEEKVAKESNKLKNSDERLGTSIKPTKTEEPITITNISSDEMMKEGFLEWVRHAFDKEVSELIDVFGETAAKNMIWNVFRPDFQKFVDGEAWDFSAETTKEFKTLVKRTGCEGGRCDVANGITCRKHSVKVYPIKANKAAAGGEQA